MRELRLCVRLISVLITDLLLDCSSHVRQFGHNSGLHERPVRWIPSARGRDTEKLFDVVFYVVLYICSQQSGASAVHAITYGNLC